MDWQTIQLGSDYESAFDYVSGPAGLRKSGLILKKEHDPEGSLSKKLDRHLSMALVSDLLDKGR